jgi:peptide/nickel transport system permease protein
LCMARDSSAGRNPIRWHGNMVVTAEGSAHKKLWLPAHTFFRSPSLVVAACILLLASLAAIVPDQIGARDSLHQELRLRLRAPGYITQSGSLYLLGTDQLGRDILSLLIAGARPAFVVAIGSTIIALVFGVTVGLMSGFWGGALDAILMRIADIQLAFPFYLLAIAVVGMVGPSLPVVLFIIAMGNWVPYGRVVRARVLELRVADYVEASRAVGSNDLRIVRKHILPNTLSPVFVLLSFNMAAAVIMEAGLSFVGLGVPGSIPSWGRMLSEGRDFVATSWWLPLFPGLCIFLVVLSINLVGDFVREVIDPKMRSDLLT